MKKFQTVALGGTFDRLHAGHEAFLDFALSKGQTLIIGLTSDVYVRHHKSHANTLSYDIRKKDLEEYFLKRHALDRVIISPIDENDIPTNYQKTVDALIVTNDTFEGAENLNRKRMDRGLSPLPIVPMQQILAEDNDVIASTRIRQGRIDRTGKSYLADDMYEVAYVLPQNMRKELSRPIGEMIDESAIPSLKEASCLVTVGDITTKTFLENGIVPDISVVDFVVERVNRFNSIADIGFLGSEHVYHIENKKSTISPLVFQTLAHLFYSNRNSGQHAVIVVSGEEDLIVLPVILLAPLGCVIVYGQPKKGMVKVEVTENLKQEMREMLEQFEKKSQMRSH